ncbi:hypothetical protein IV498_06275 [Paenarthrobacter sp. Z7-10]|uniref:DUF6541 family protein n=1 Tax=Paenarthrobacter sp. Z7-10 TaxID=2787635 RepID=UPI0022A97185|nr:DUF6541 family protein [Paenarthrobacter sp. Z7-10]MCZ2402803.1 hypothetical protein [Paenarthrobacter sp. Z7-10]
MTWSQTAPALIVSVMVIFVPGAILARACGARGLAWAATAAPLTVSLVSVGAIAAQLVHVRWSIAALTVLTLGTSTVAAVLRILWLRRPGHGSTAAGGRGRTQPWLPRWEWPSYYMTLSFLVGLAIPAGIILIRFAHIFGSPDALSQTYDNVFHLNAVRFILDTGHGSSLTLGSLDAAGGASFYPGAWHDLVALVVQATSIPIPVGVNISNIVMAALVWPIGAMYLTSRIIGCRPTTLLLTGALAAGFSSFPYLMIDFGVLFPNLLAIALLPTSLALVADILGLSVLPRSGALTALILLAVISPGVALAHPSVLMALLALSIPLAISWLCRRIAVIHRAGSSAIRYIPAVVLVVVYLSVVVVLWNKIRPTAKASFWPPTQSVAQALGEAVTSAPEGRPVPWAIFVLTVIGIAVLLARRKSGWMLGAFALCCLFYIAVTSFPKGAWRSFLGGVWYNDGNRLAALLPVLALPLAAAGGAWLLDKLQAAVNRRRAAAVTALRPSGRIILDAAAALLLAILVQGASVGMAQSQAAGPYRLSPRSPLLTSDEETLLSRADKDVPPGAVVIGNPATGTALVYALANRQAMLPAIGSSESAPEAIIARKLNQASTDPAVCPAVRKLNSMYVLDFGEQEVNKGHHPFPGLTNLSTAQGFQLIDSQGEARLYRVTACG